MCPYSKQDGKREEDVGFPRCDIAELLIEELNPDIVVMERAKPILRRVLRFEKGEVDSCYREDSMH